MSRAVSASQHALASTDRELFRVSDVLRHETSCSGCPQGQHEGKATRRCVSPLTWMHASTVIRWHEHTDRVQACRVLVAHPRTCALSVYGGACLHGSCNVNDYLLWSTSGDSGRRDAHWWCQVGGGSPPSPSALHGPLRCAVRRAVRATLLLSPLQQYESHRRGGVESLRRAGFKEGIPCKHACAVHVAVPWSGSV